MNRQELIELRLQPAIRECDLHQSRIDYASKNLSDKFPMTAKGWSELDDETIADIDQLLFRFGKLQDAIGRRLFPAILMLAAEWSESESFIDKLNRLEKLGVIPSTDQWNQLRELRNESTHEYPDAPEKNAANLNLVHEALQPLRETLNQAKTYATSHFLNAAS
jgi:hypothetical protein